LAECSGVLFVDARDIWPTVSHTTALIEVPRPGYSEQVIAWTSLIGDLSPGSPAALANQFNLNLPDIRQIAQPAMAGTNHSPADLHRQLWDACLIRSRAQLDKLAQRIEPKATWDDLVLPDDEKNLLRQITSQVRQRSIVIEEWGFDQQTSRGLGLSILFAGESGTGKTMAAEVMANELQLNLYRIDLSSVVDKYIGETEKRLRQLFDEAENGGVILFFDEADALFGKRSEVKDSHDRYANIEINYLLQRMESFSRLAILASNMKSLLDNAFLRRLRFIVNFPYPGPAERKLIWQRVFPRETPLGDLDYNWLARLNLTGGNIHTVALNAAFLAANQPPGHQQVTMPLVLEAARNEFRKLDKPMNEADFHWEPNGQVRV
jgi:SpoVK/Ycf46/Vps4 family AAA+-type ATPase